MHYVLQKDITIPAGTVLERQVGTPRIEPHTAYMLPLADNEEISLVCPVASGSFEFSNLFKPLP